VKVLLHADGHTAKGGSPLICHNERLADPLDTFTRAIAGISKKRNKTEADYEAMGRIEFLGSLYTEPPMDDLADASNGHVPCLPAWNVIRCLQDGATRQKRGRDVLAGVYPLATHTTLEFDGPTVPAEMWQSGAFIYRAKVGVQRSATMRTRVIFVDWQFQLPVEVDSTVFDVDTLALAWKDAGIYKGIGDRRPVNGRFAGTVEVTEP